MKIPRRLRRLHEQARSLGLQLTVEPSRELAMQLTDMAWIRNGGLGGEEDAWSQRLPWVIHGKRDGREVAVFAVQGAMGSVFGARIAYEGPVIRIDDARDPWADWKTAGWWPIACAGFLFLLSAAGAVGFLLQSREVLGILAAILAMLLALPLRHWVRARWPRPIREAEARDANSTVVQLKDPAFALTYRARCVDPEIAHGVLAEAVRKTMLGTPAAVWWTIGHGWVSVVIVWTPGALSVRRDDIDQTIYAVVQTANAIEDALGGEGGAGVLTR